MIIFWCALLTCSNNPEIPFRILPPLQGADDTLSIRSSAALKINPSTSA
jgi:hypothetical protein